PGAARGIENAGTLASSGHRHVDRPAANLPPPLLGEEKEVLLAIAVVVIGDGNGTAQSPAKIVIAYIALALMATDEEEIDTVQIVVAQEFKSRTMESMATALGYDVDHAVCG